MKLKLWSHMWISWYSIEEHKQHTENDGEHDEKRNEIKSPKIVTGSKCDVWHFTDESKLIERNPPSKSEILVKSVYRWSFFFQFCCCLLDFSYEERHTLAVSYAIPHKKTNEIERSGEIMTKHSQKPISHTQQ